MVVLLQLSSALLTVSQVSELAEFKVQTTYYQGVIRRRFFSSQCRCGQQKKIREKHRMPHDKQTNANKITKRLQNVNKNETNCSYKTNQEWNTMRHRVILMIFPSILQSLLTNIVKWREGETTPWNFTCLSVGNRTIGLLLLLLLLLILLLLLLQVLKYCWNIVTGIWERY